MPQGKPQIDPDKPISLRELAALVGPRVQGRPTTIDTVRRWCLQGLQGVTLDSWLNVSVRMTTWGAFCRWRDRVVAKRQEEARQRVNAARQAVKDYYASQAAEAT